MKQILQSARSGKLELVEVPAPTPQPGQVFVRNHYSVVSPGTERLMMDFARKSLAAKARSRPDLVQQVIRKLRHDGPLATYRSVTTRLDAPQPLGYSTAGVVEGVGPGVTRFRVGDRVACAGAGYANHAEFVAVPENLVVAVPDGLSLEQAAFATIGAIALQGVRIAGPTLGEVGVVVGLGLIGQLSVQLLAANGCRVLGLDLDPSRVDEARALGAEWAAAPDALADDWRESATAGYGADFALVTAASKTAGPIETAADLCRAKGRVVVVGMMPMELDRRSFYDKELELRMSMSYGPGRYDRRYEELGLDYPLPYVRWTENRNMESFLRLAASGRIDPGALDCAEHAFERATETYEGLADGSIREPCVVFRYGEAQAPSRSVVLAKRTADPGRLGTALLGAGSYANSVLLPALAALPELAFTHVVTATGSSGLRAGEKYGFSHCGTDPADAFADPATGLVMVATRHDTHASLGIQALRAGKAVWLEKPAGLHPGEVAELASAVEETGGFLTVGYNRRFSSHARALRAAFEGRTTPLAIHYRVAAGPTPVGTWITDPRVGGGRVLGEICHFVDLCAYLIGGLPQAAFARRLGSDPERDDATVAMLEFEDGSTALIEYLTATGPEVPKERFEISGAGRTGRCDNFRTSQLPGGKRVRSANQDKGQATALGEVVAAIREGRPSPFTLDEIVAVSAATFAIERSCASGRREPVVLAGEAPG